MFANIFNFSSVFHAIAILFIYGGWVLILAVIVAVFYKLYRFEIYHHWLHSQTWVMLQIRAPKENLVSTMAVESVFSQMHAVHAGLTFAEEFVEGKDQPWYSLEIISMGGKISYLIRTVKEARDLVEASIYAQYPEAEITEVRDYMENINYDPETSQFNLWGCDYKLMQDDVIPIKTYRDFEHPSAEEKIIDPLTPLFEALNKMEPHEFYGIQIIIQPLADNEWKPRGEEKVRELMGQEGEHKTTLGSLLMAPFDAFANLSLGKMLNSAGHDHDEKDDKTGWMNLTDVEKERITLIQRKIGKPGYKTKMRHLYIAPKDKYDGTKKGLVVGAYRPLGSVMTNQFKPDTSRTWTSVKYKISPTLEKPYIDWEERRRKVNVFNGYKDRNIHIGLPMFVLNIEELATLFHFPISTQTVAAAIERTESKKSQAPINLPVAE